MRAVPSNAQGGNSNWQFLTTNFRAFNIVFCVRDGRGLVPIFYWHGAKRPPHNLSRFWFGSPGPCAAWVTPENYYEFNKEKTANVIRAFHSGGLFVSIFYLPKPQNGPAFGKRISTSIQREGGSHNYGDQNYLLLPFLFFCV